MIPLFSPIRQNEAFFSTFIKETESLLRNGQYILGEKVTEFESKLAEVTGYQYAEACSSGTEALVLALRALQLPPNSDVITPALSFVASANTIAWAGHRPVFADIDEKTHCVSVETLEAARTPNTRAVFAVDLYGRQAPIREIRKWCDTHKLFLIEDGAQSIGVPNSGADIYTTSFYPTKNIGAIGDAGAVMTSDPVLAARVRQLVRQGEIVRDHYEVVGTNGRMDTLQAAFLLHKLPHLREWSEKRTSIAKRYHRALEGREARLPLLDEHPNVWSLFVIGVPADERGAYVERFKSQGVGVGIYYSRAVNTQPSMQPFEPRACPNAEKFAKEVIAIPIFPELTEDEIKSVMVSLETCIAPSSI